MTIPVAMEFMPARIGMEKPKARMEPAISATGVSLRVPASGIGIS